MLLHITPYAASGILPFYVFEESFRLGPVWQKSFVLNVSLLLDFYTLM